MAAGRTAWRVGHRTLLARTCSTCGQLRQATDYRKIPNGYYQTQCVSCQHQSAKNSDLRRNSASQASANKSKEPWVLRDIDTLKELTKAGLSAREIGIEMGRSLQSIYIARTRFCKD